MNKLRNIIIAVMAAMLTATPVAHAVEEGFFQEADEWIVEECGEMWSSYGEFSAYLEDDGVGNGGVSDEGIYRASLGITFTQSDINAFECVGDKIEVHFLIGGFNLTDEVHIQNNSDVTSTLPRGRQMLTYFVENDTEATLRYGRIKVDELHAGVRYETQLSFWGLAPDQNNNPWVSIRLGLVTEDEGTIPLVLTRGHLADVLYFHRGGRLISFGY